MRPQTDTKRPSPPNVGMGPAAIEMSLPVDAVADAPSVKRGRGVRLASFGVLWFLGVVSAAVYLFAFVRRFPLAGHYAKLDDLGGMSGHDARSAILYFGPIIVLFVLYGLACWCIRYAVRRVGLVVVYIFAPLFGLIAADEYPITAIDLYVYLVYGRVWVSHGANPLITPPKLFPADPFLHFAGQFGQVPAPYGPLWIVLAGLPTRLFGDNLLLSLLGLKALAVISYLGCCIVITWMLLRIHPEIAPAGTLLFAWNPLVLLDGVGNGHNDLAMMFLVLLAVGLAQSGRDLPGLALLALSVAVKYSSGLLLPVLYVQMLRQRQNWRARLGFTVAAAVVIMGVLLLCYAPFWAGSATFGGLRRQNDMFLASPAVLLFAWQGTILPKMSPDQLKVRLDLAFAAYYLIQIGLLWKGWRTWLMVTFDIVFGSLFVIPWFNSWYAIWPLALAPVLSSDRVSWRAASLSFTVLLGTFFYTYKPVWDQVGWDFSRAYLLVVPVVFGPPLLLSLWPRGWGRRCPVTACPPVP